MITEGRNEHYPIVLLFLTIHPTGMVKTFLGHDNTGLSQTEAAWLPTAEIGMEAKPEPAWWPSPDTASQPETWLPATPSPHPPL